jgi:hypothetical protein
VLPLTLMRLPPPPPGKSGAALAAGARRQDIVLKYCKYGRSQVMPDDKTAYFASSTQLAYGERLRAAAVPHGRCRAGQGVTGCHAFAAVVIGPAF